MKDKKKQNIASNIGLFIILILIKLSAQITIKGFVPPEINEDIIAFEYENVHRILAPNRKIDNSPLSVTFFTKHGSEKMNYSLPEWGGGGAIGMNTIVVNIDKNPFLNHNTFRTTVHELTHIVINRIAGDLPIPRWFHEGVAMNLSGDATQEENYTISKALFMGSLMPFSSIDSVNAFGMFRAELAYCQSRQAVNYLIKTYGQEVLGEILDASVITGSFWIGVQNVLELSEMEIEHYSREYIFNTHGKFLWLVDKYIIWVCILFLFFLAYAMSVIRVRKKKALLAMEDLELEEELEQEKRNITR